MALSRHIYLKAFRMAHSEHHKPSIVLLGTGHWSNPGVDYRQHKFDDMLSPWRQQEIEECLQSLVAIEPTKVALEVERHDEAALNTDYAAYRAGDYALTSNERHQIGFRLAAMLGHPRVHAIDWHHPTQPIGWDDAISFAEHHGQQHLISFFSAAQNGPAAERNRIHQTHVRDLLLESSDTTCLMEHHEVYMDMAQIGSGAEYVGADVILRWYERNMKIFVNISRLAVSPNERVLVLIGGGHLPLLTHFVEGAGRFRLEPASRYLTQGINITESG